MIKSCKNKRDKTPSKLIGVNGIESISNYIRTCNIGFKSFTYLCYIVNRYRSLGLHSTYTGVYNHHYAVKDGNTFRIVTNAIYVLEDKGLIVIDRTNSIREIYPTEKSLKEISAFI